MSHYLVSNLKMRSHYRLHHQLLIYSKMTTIKALRTIWIIWLEWMPTIGQEAELMDLTLVVIQIMGLLRKHQDQVGAIPESELFLNFRIFLWKIWENTQSKCQKFSLLWLHLTKHQIKFPTDLPFKLLPQDPDSLHHSMTRERDPLILQLLQPREINSHL